MRSACISAGIGEENDAQGVRVIALFVVVGARVDTAHPTGRSQHQDTTMPDHQIFKVPFMPSSLRLVSNDTPCRQATYSGIPVYEMCVIFPHSTRHALTSNACRMCKGVAVMRRRSDSWLNATQILKVAGFDKPQRTRVLEREIQKGEHEKVQGGYGKYQGQFTSLIHLPRLQPVSSQAHGYRSSEDSPSRGNTIVKQPFVLSSSSRPQRKARPSLRNISYPPLPSQDLPVALQPPSPSQVLLSLVLVRAIMPMLKKIQSMRYFPNPVQKMAQ